MYVPNSNLRNGADGGIEPQVFDLVDGILFQVMQVNLETRKEMFLMGVFPEVCTAKLATSPAFISPQIDTSTLPVNLNASYSDLHSSFLEVKFLNQL